MKQQQAETFMGRPVDAYPQRPQVQTEYLRGGRWHLYTTARETPKHAVLRRTYAARTTVGRVVGWSVAAGIFVLDKELFSVNYAECRKAWLARKAQERAARKAAAAAAAGAGKGGAL